MNKPALGGAHEAAAAVVAGRELVTYEGEPNLVENAANATKQERRAADSLRAAYQRGKTHALAVIAEGAKCGVHELMEYYGAHRKSIGFDLRVTRLGHVVRGGIPSAADRVLATRLGAAAIETLANGKHGVLVGIIKGDVAVTPLAEITGKMRPADASLLELARVMAI